MVENLGNLPEIQFPIYDSCCTVHGVILQNLKGSIWWTKMRALQI